MEDDIVPALLDTINQQFDLKTSQSKTLTALLESAKANKATYLDANKFAIEIGETLANVLGSNLSSSSLPDGRMYYNIGQRILGSTLKKNHALITGYTNDIQRQLNSKANIGLKVQTPEFNQSRLDGMVNRLDNEPVFDKVAWMVQEPIVNFSQSIVDDSVKKNVEFQSRSGLHPTLTRRIVGKGCKWCRNLAGVYQYPDVPEDIYRRHENDRCIVEYNPKDGRGIQNSHTKKWRAEKQKSTLESRKELNVKRSNLVDGAFDKTNMKTSVGNKNYAAFAESLGSMKTSKAKTLLKKLGNRMEFSSLSENKNFVLGKAVTLSQSSFTGSTAKNPLQVVYHELGHAVDNLGGESFDTWYDRVSEMPQYKLKNNIKKDLLNFVNGELASLKGDDFQKVKNLKKIDVFDQGAIVRKYKKLAEENPKMYSALSDMMESSGGFIDHPLGSGNGLKYWKTNGKQEAEFFAHMTESLVNDDARKMLYDLFPTASATWEKMLDDILKKVK